MRMKSNILDSWHCHYQISSTSPGAITLVDVISEAITESHSSSDHRDIAHCRNLIKVSVPEYDLSGMYEQVGERERLFQKSAL